VEYWLERPSRPISKSKPECAQAQLIRSARLMWHRSCRSFTPEPSRMREMAVCYFLLRGHAMDYEFPFEVPERRMSRLPARVARAP
jgi:hypothetical protein